jgi:hypothetical protein
MPFSLNRGVRSLVQKTHNNLLQWQQDRSPLVKRDRLSRGADAVRLIDYSRLGSNDERAGRILAIEYGCKSFLSNNHGALHRPYIQQLLSLKSMQAWEAAALQEPWRDPEHERENLAAGVILLDARNEKLRQ